VADQGTKALVRAYLPLGDSYSIVPYWLELTHVRNTGAAFGFLNNGEFPYKTLVMLAMVLAALAVYAMQLGLDERLARLGMAVILGGALARRSDARCWAMSSASSTCAGAGSTSGRSTWRMPRSGSLRVS